MDFFLKYKLCRHNYIIPLQRRGSIMPAIFGQFKPWIIDRLNRHSHPKNKQPAAMLSQCHIH